MMASRGYDMTPTMYSPDGRIYQVEYAIETVKRGAIAIGLQAKDGIIIAVEEVSRDLQVEDITQKIFQVDDHVGIAAAGYIPDARILVDNARFFSQSNKLTYDESVEIETVAKTFSRSITSIYTIFWSSPIWCRTNHCWGGQKGY